MLVLHGAWLPAVGGREPRLAIWAESPEHVAARAARRLAPGKLHPFAARVPELAAALAAGCLPAPGAESAVLYASLPTNEQGPLPSPDAGGELQPQASHARWRIEALLLPPHDAGALLAALGHGGGQPFHVAPDLLLWATAYRYALDLVYRGRLVPTITRSPRRYEGRWLPLLDHPEDAERFAALLRAMPPAAAALTRRFVDEPPAPSTSLRDFLAKIADACARQSVQSVRPPRRWWLGGSAAAWLADLGIGSDDRHDAGSLSPIAPLVRQWLSPVLGEPDAHAAPFRLSLRLEPPESAAEPWRLVYFLQARDDPSLLVPAAAVWHQRSAVLSVLTRNGVDPASLLLRELGRAASLVPAIAAGLRDALPEHCTMTAAEAFTFIRQPAAALREQDIAVTVPAFLARLGVRLNISRARKTERPEGHGLFGMDAITQFDWQVAVGDATLTRAEFEALARMKEPLVQVRGQWVELQPEAVEQVLAFLKRRPDGESTLATAMHLALAPETDSGPPLESVTLDPWFDQVLAEISGAAREETVEPPGFTGTLRHYQQTGVSWMATLRRFGLGACLADDMGLGKSVEVIALLLHTRRTGSPHPPSLIVCPTSVVGNWRHELTRFAPGLRVLVHHGAKRERERLPEQAARHDVVISAYPLLHRDADALAGIQWADVILDEAQNIKNPSTKAAQSARRLPAGWRAALTGTPVENRLSDLWSIFQFLNPGYLGSGEDFRRRFTVPIEKEQDAAAAARLRTLVAPFLLRRVKTDRHVISDLPEKNEMKVFCTLTKEQATLYQAVVRDAMKQIGESEGFGRRGRVLAALTRLKQTCDHPALMLSDNSRLAGRSGKLARLTEMLEEVVAVDDRALVFTQFAAMGALLQRHLTEALSGEVLFLHGGTPALERDAMVRRFQEEEQGPRIFVLSIKAGGSGLNLTRAAHVFHYDRWWNPAVENQATDRAFRIGQHRNVQVHKFICAGTLEERIDLLIERKAAMAETITGASEAWLTEMSTEQLRDLLGLRAGAVEE